MVREGQELWFLLHIVNIALGDKTVTMQDRDFEQKKTTAIQTSDQQQYRLVDIRVGTMSKTVTIQTRYQNSD